MAFVWNWQGRSSDLAEALRSDYRQTVLRRLSSRLEEELRSMAEALRRDARKVERSMAGRDPDPEWSELTATIDHLVLTTLRYLESNREDAALGSEVLELYDALADTRHQVRRLLDALWYHEPVTHP